MGHGLLTGDVLHELPGSFLVLAVGGHDIAQAAHVGLVVHSHGGHLDQLDLAVCRQRAVLQHAGLPGADEDDGRLAGDEEVGALGLRQHGVGGHLLIVHQVHHLLDGVLGLRQGDAAGLAVLAEIVAAVLIQEVHPGRLGIQLHDDGILTAAGSGDGIPQLGGDVPHVIPGPALLRQLHTVAVEQLGVQRHHHSVQPLGQGVLLAVHIVGVHTALGIDAHIKALALDIAVQGLQHAGVHVFLDVGVHPEHIRGLVGLQRGVQLGPVGVPGDLLDGDFDLALMGGVEGVHVLLDHRQLCLVPQGQRQADGTVGALSAATAAAGESRGGEDQRQGQEQCCNLLFHTDSPFVVSFPKTPRSGGSNRFWHRIADPAAALPLLDGMRQQDLRMEGLGRLAEQLQ